MALLKKPISNSSFFSLSFRNILVWVMAMYILVDVGMHIFHSGNGQLIQGLQNTVTGKPSEVVDNDKLVHATRVDTPAHCNSVDAYIDVNENDVPKAEDPWGQLKSGLPPADCPVNGLLIERLDPLTNYRRGVALRFTSDLDDKTPLDPWFLGSKVNLNKAGRRVYIDFGANDFKTSVLWFMERYPVDFTEVHAFETNPSLFRLPAGWDDESNWVEPAATGWHKIRSRQAVVPSWLLKRVHYYNKFAGVEDRANSLNVTRWMKEELKLSPEDTVIVKMDIEGAEWPILNEWVADPDMPKIIDELFVELHYYHPDNNWDYKWSREDATKLLATLRFKGFYAHYWD